MSVAMTDRIVCAALFFGAAAVLWWMSALLFSWADPLDFIAESAFVGGPTLVAALIAGGVAARRLAVDARASGVASRGLWKGAVVTVAAYVLSVILVVASLAFADGSVVGLDLLLLFFVALYGLIFLSPGVFLGAISGWIFYRWMLRPE